MTTRIVILGGGFAGVSTAQELVKILRREGRLARPDGAAGPSTTAKRDGAARRDGAASSGPSTVSVTLINRDNYFVFQPLLADMVSGAIETTHVVVPLRRMLRGVDVEVGYRRGDRSGPPRDPRPPAAERRDVHRRPTTRSSLRSAA